MKVEPVLYHGGHLSPSSIRSLGSPGSYTPSWSAKSAPKMAQSSSRWCQSAHLQAEHDTDVVQRPLGEQPLVTRAVVGPRTTLSLVLIDNEDALSRPTQEASVIREGVLPRCRFAVFLHLLR